MYDEVNNYFDWKCLCITAYTEKYEYYKFRLLIRKLHYNNTRVYFLPEKLKKKILKIQCRLVIDTVATWGFSMRSFFFPNIVLSMGLTARQICKYHRISLNDLINVSII